MPVREKAAAVSILVDSAFRKHNWGCLFINEEKWFPAGFLSLLNLWAVCMFWAKACCLSQNILFLARHWVTDQLCLISSQKCIFRFTQLHFRVTSLLIFVNLTWNELYGTLRDWAASSSTSSCDTSFCKAYFMYPSFHMPLQEYLLKNVGILKKCC